jgi:hypothetical protein
MRAATSADSREGSRAHCFRRIIFEEHAVELFAHLRDDRVAECFRRILKGRGAHLFCQKIGDLRRRNMNSEDFVDRVRMDGERYKPTLGVGQDPVLIIVEIRKAPYKIPHFLVIRVENVGTAGVDCYSRLIFRVVTVSRDVAVLFDHKDLFALFGRDACGSSPGQTGANDNDVEIMHMLPNFWAE